MINKVFDPLYSLSSRIAAVRAATIVMLHLLPNDARNDFEQEALLELWRKRAVFDARRGSWRTFAERIVANRISSLVRRMHSKRSCYLREEPLENILGFAAPDDRPEIRIDVCRVLVSMSKFDQSVAACLIDHSAAETGRCLGVSRATVYRAIARLRGAFTEAGLSS